MSDQAIHENHLRTDLMSLRPILEQPGDSRWIDFFDNFLEHHEFGLAFLCICDYLLESQTKAPEAGTLDLIVKLQTQMEIEDDCVVQLLERQK